MPPSYHSKVNPPPSGRVMTPMSPPPVVGCLNYNLVNGLLSCSPGMNLDPCVCVLAGRDLGDSDLEGNSNTHNKKSDVSYPYNGNKKAPTLSHNMDSSIVDDCQRWFSKTCGSHVSLGPPKSNHCDIAIAGTKVMPNFDHALTICPNVKSLVSRIETAIAYHKKWAPNIPGAVCSMRDSDTNYMSKCNNRKQIDQIEHLLGNVSSHAIRLPLK